MLERIRGFRLDPVVGIALLLSCVMQVVLVMAIGTAVSGGDAHTYLTLAADWHSLDRLLSPEAFEGNFWPAGYSGFLALFTPLGEAAVLWVRLTQVAMVLSMALLAGALARSVSERARKVTIILVAFSPTLVWATWAIGYELLLGWLLLVGLVLVWRGRPRSWPGPLLGGLSVGLALIVQFRAVSVLPVLAYLAWRRGRRVAATWTIGLLLPMVAWSVRSLVATGSPAPWSTNGGYNLWNGNGPHATGHNVFPLPAIPASEASQASAALHWIASNPSSFFDLVSRKAIALFYPTQFADIAERIPAEGLLTVAQWAYSLAMVALLAAFVGFAVWRIHGPLNRMMPVLLMATFYLAPNVLFIVEARFRIPAESLLLAVCAATLTTLAHRWRRPPGRPSGVPPALGVRNHHDDEQGHGYQHAAPPQSM